MNKISEIFKEKNKFPILVKKKLPINVIKLSSSLPPFGFSYLLANKKSKLLFFTFSNILNKYEGFMEPSALITQKKVVLTELIPSIKAEPYPIFF